MAIPNPKFLCKNMYCPSWVHSLVKHHSSDDPRIAVSVDIHLEVASTPLVAKIKGGRQRDIGYTQPLLLDASLSYDPDRSYAYETFYDWECMDAGMKILPISSRPPILDFPSFSGIRYFLRIMTPGRTYIVDDSLR